MDDKNYNEDYEKETPFQRFLRWMTIPGLVIIWGIAAVFGYHADKPEIVYSKDTTDYFANAQFSYEVGQWGNVKTTFTSDYENVNYQITCTDTCQNGDEYTIQALVPNAETKVIKMPVENKPTLLQDAADISEDDWKELITEIIDTYIIDDIQYDETYRSQDPTKKKKLEKVRLIKVAFSSTPAIRKDNHITNGSNKLLLAFRCDSTFGFNYYKLYSIDSIMTYPDRPHEYTYDFNSLSGQGKAWQQSKIDQILENPILSYVDEDGAMIEAIPDVYIPEDKTFRYEFAEEEENTNIDDINEEMEE